MDGMNFRSAYEFDPETYGGEGGGLPGMLSRYLQEQSRQQEGVDFRSTPGDAPNYNPETSFSPQGGLLGSLLSLHAEQSRKQTFAENGGQPPPVSPDPNFRQLARMPKGAVLPMADPFAPPGPQAQYEADQAQQAREAASMRLARGVRDPVRAETQRDFFNADPVDIARSAAIGVVNGAVNAAGLPGDALTGFGYFPRNFVPNIWRLSNELPLLPTDEPDYWKSWGSAEFRQRLENRYGEFYKPESRAGRFAETIGEMMPMIVGGEALGVVRGAQTAGTAIRELPATVAKHAVAPGMAVQALEEAMPDSPVGRTVQKAYPVLRRVLPAVLATKRYVGG